MIFVSASITSTPQFDSKQKMDVNSGPKGFSQEKLYLKLITMNMQKQWLMKIFDINAKFPGWYNLWLK